MIPSIYGQLANTGTIADPLVQAAAAALAAQSAAAATASATDTLSTTGRVDFACNFNFLQMSKFN